MNRWQRALVWAAGCLVAAVLLFLLRGVLLPFVLGMLIAYFLDPVADQLQARGFSRTLAASFILLTFFLIVVLAFIALVPPLQQQIVALFRALPDMIETLRERLQPIIERYWEGLSDQQAGELRDAASGYATGAMKWAGGLLIGLWSGGAAVLDVLSLFIITPVVAFYLLRDWNNIVGHVDSLLPQKSAPTIRRLAAEIDRMMARFIRGQATVCAAMAVFYAVALSLVGLKFGLLIGLAAGIVTFIPYIGAASGLAVGMGVALVQFHDWPHIALVGLVFAVGQVLESYVLTPKLVGESIGLHPVWLLFALMAGGSLLGFTGVLVAVPVAAAIGVLVRHWIAEYRDSDLYREPSGDGPPES